MNGKKLKNVRYLIYGEKYELKISRY